MTGIRGRRARLAVLVAAMVLVAAGCVSFTGTKVIEGDAPPGAEFEVEIVCVHETDGELFTETFVFTEDGQTLTTPFPPHEIPPGQTTCTIVETEDAGATGVEYQCGTTVTPVEEPEELEEAVLDAGLGGGPGASVAARGAETFAECSSADPDEGLRVFISMQEGTTPGEGDSRIDVEFTVINTFEEPPPTTAPPTTTTAPPPAPAAEAAAPSEVTFTG